MLRSQGVGPLPKFTSKILSSFVFRANSKQKRERRKGLVGLEADRTAHSKRR